MAVETNVRTIDDLDPTYPAKSDYISEGDDHIRLIKHTLQNTFPNADAPLNSPFSELTKVTDYMSFKKDSNGGNVIEFKSATTLKNVAKSGADTDIASVAQVKDLISNYLSNTVYRVGSYYISDDQTHPTIALNLPTTKWVQVTGFLAGAGAYNGGALDKQSVIISAGQDGGSPSVAVQPQNLPRTAVDLSQVSTSTDTHSHTNPVHDIRISIDDKHNFVTSTNPSENNATTSTNSYAHSHTIQGAGYFGYDDNQRQAISTLPNFHGTYIWRRLPN